MEYLIVHWFFWKKTDTDGGPCVLICTWIAPLTKRLLLKTYFSVGILISLMSRAVWSWMNMCFSRCSFLIKIVPLDCNWCYQRLGRSHMGGELQVRPRWYRWAEETGSLCAILSGWRSELRSSRPDWTPLVCAALPLHRECTELLWTPLVFIVSTGAWISPESSHAGSCSTLVHKESTVLWSLYTQSIRRDQRLVYVKTPEKITPVEAKHVKTGSVLAEFMGTSVQSTNVRL